VSAHSDRSFLSCVSLDCYRVTSTYPRKLTGGEGGQTVKGLTKEACEYGDN